MTVAAPLRPDPADLSTLVAAAGFAVLALRVLAMAGLT